MSNNVAGALHPHELRNLSHGRRHGTTTLGLAALGVVFGDIGTSPLYTLHARAWNSTDAREYPWRISLIFWSLTMVVTVGLRNLACSSHLRLGSWSSGAWIALPKHPARPLCIDARPFCNSQSLSHIATHKRNQYLPTLDIDPMQLPKFCSHRELASSVPSDAHLIYALGVRVIRRCQSHPSTSNVIKSRDCKGKSMDVPAELYPALSHYGGKSHEHSRLSPEEALELHRRFRDCRDEQARRYLVRAYTRYAIAMSLKYCQYGLPLSSLIAEGKVGIVDALNKFDFECGNRFLTYVAYWIRLCLLNYVIHSLESTDLNSETPRLFKLRREKVRITNLLGEGNDDVQYFSDRTNLRAAHNLTLENASVTRSALRAAP